VISCNAAGADRSGGVNQQKRRLNVERLRDTVGTMVRLAGLALAITMVAVVHGEHHYFHSAKVVSIEQQRGVQLYVIDSPLFIFTARYNQTAFHRSPRITVGPIRVSIKRSSEIGDEVYLLDPYDKEYKATIVARKGHPPPPAVP
jgi:hypothetical protein